MQTLSKFQSKNVVSTNKNGIIQSTETEKKFDFLEAFKNMYIPSLTNGRQQYQVPYDEFVKCLESLSYKVVTTKEEYEKRGVQYGSIVRAWCPLKHAIVEVKLSNLMKHCTSCAECGNIKGTQTRAVNRAKKIALKNKHENNNNEIVPLTPAPEKEFDFIEAFKNCYIPTSLGSTSIQIPYKEAVLCLTSLSYEVITTKEEYEKRERASILRAWCPMRHCIAEINVSLLLRLQSTHCEECGKIKGKQTNLLRYNVENVFQNEEIKEKAKQTMEEKYGVRHSMQNNESFMKARETCKQKFGYEYAMQNEEVKTKLGDIMEDNYGVRNPMQNPEIKERQQQSLEDNYGVRNPMHHPEIVERQQQSLKDNYGVRHAMQHPELKEKQQQSLEDNYGVRHAMQHPELKEKQQQTLEENYGVRNPMQNPEIRERQQETLEENYGVRNPMQNTEIRERQQQTMEETYGVKYAMQCPELFKKNQDARYQNHDYILPSGKIITYQGYEYFCLDELLENEGISEEDIVTPHYQNEKLPKIWYWDEETKKERRYYPDFYIQSLNKIIEVKCRYTYEDEKFFRINNLKAQACKKAGYNFEFRIYDRKGKLESIIVV